MMECTASCHTLSLGGRVGGGGGKWQKQRHVFCEWPHSRNHLAFSYFLTTLPCINYSQTYIFGLKMGSTYYSNVARPKLHVTPLFFS